MQKFFFVLGGLLLAASVGLGAYGAHANLVSRDIWMTAWQLHVFHALGLLIIATILPTRAQFVGGLQLFGLVFFSGSLYLQALGITERSPLAPVGGSAWILSWLIFSWLCARSRESKT